MDLATLTGQPWFADVAKVFQGIPAQIWGAILGAESGGNPSAAGDCILSYDAKGQPVYGPCGGATLSGPTSLGLFQLHQQGGQGTGYTVAQLTNPVTNAQIAAQAIIPAYNRAKGQGYTGAELAYQTAVMSGHTVSKQAIVQNYPQGNAWQRLQDALTTFYGYYTGIAPPTNTSGQIGYNPVTTGQVPKPSFTGLQAYLIAQAKVQNEGFLQAITHPGQTVAFAFTEGLGVLFSVVFFGIGAYIVFVNSSGPSVAQSIAEPVQKVASMVTKQPAETPNTPEPSSPLKLSKSDFANLAPDVRKTAEEAHAQGGPEKAGKALTKLLGRTVLVA